MGRAILAFSPRDEVTAHLQRIKLVSYTSFTKTDPQEILDELDEIRTKGYSIVTNEMTHNLQAVGAPIFRAGGSVVGGISLSGDPAQLADVGVEQVARRVVETAGHISQQMGYFSFEPVFHSRRG
jgi:DNA-binding IclR family transcriptional regulator